MPALLLPEFPASVLIPLYPLGNVARASSRCTVSLLFLVSFSRARNQDIDLPKLHLRKTVSLFVPRPVLVLVQATARKHSAIACILIHTFL
jgi:hypothetical protein